MVNEKTIIPPKAPRREERVPPSEIIRRKMAEMPPPTPPSKTPEEKAAAPFPKKAGKLNLLSIITLVLLILLAVFTVFTYFQSNSKIAEVKTAVTRESPELAAQKTKIESLEKNIIDTKTENEEKFKGLEDKISKLSQDFASKADLISLENILKATDTDKDGLSDYEEVTIYKSNPNKRDTDGDGFADKDEVDRGYSPIGPGKLILEEKPTTEEKAITKITASNYKFEPSIIEVEAGKEVRLEVTSSDSNHTFTIDELEIDQEIKAYATEVIEFIPEETGEYTFYSNTREDKAQKMEGKLIVK